MFDFLFNNLAPTTPFRAVLLILAAIGLAFWVTR